MTIVFQPTARSLEAALRDVARAVLHDARPLSESDRQFLYDLQRGKHPLVPLRRLMHLSARCADPAARYALPELVRAQVDMNFPRPLGAPSLCEAIAAETQAQGALDLAKVEALTRRRDPGVCRRLLDGIVRLVDSLPALRDAAQREMAGGAR